MREIHVDEIRDNVAQICIDAAYNLSEDVLTAFDRAIETETASRGQGDHRTPEGERPHREG